MTHRPVLRRTAGHARRPRGPRRASAGLSPVRAAAAFVALLAALAIYGVGASPIFAYQHLELEGRDRLLTDPGAVEARLGLTSGGSNLFLVRTAAIAAALRELPTVSDAQVTVQLPDTLRVQLSERQPILAWVVGGERFLIDRDGLLFAAFPVDAPGPSTGLPAVTDERAASAALDVGRRLDPVDLDAATRLGSLSPADLGSAARSLRIAVDDRDGYTIKLLPDGPLAVFGFYTPSLRTPELIPGQVRLLRSLLEGREATIRRVVLASDTSGTYLPRSSPAGTVAPGGSAGPTGAP